MPVASYCAGHATSANPPDMLAVDEVGLRAARRGGALCGQDLEVVAVKRCGLRREPSPSGRPSSAACATRSPSGLRGSAAHGRPIQAVLLAGIAAERRREEARGLSIVPCCA